MTEFDGQIEMLAKHHEYKHFACGESALDEYLRRRDQLPPAHHKRFPNDPVPVARLARLAVDQSQQGKGLGKLLLLDALYRCHRLSTEIGSVGVVVDAKNASAQSFYKQMNFEEFPDTPLTLWLPGQAITRLFGI